VALEQLGMAIFVSGLQKFLSDTGAADKAIDKSAKNMTKMSKAGEHFGKAFKGIKDHLGKMTVGIVAAGAAFVKYLQFAKMGAQARETENSFKRLSEEMGLNIGYMQRLRDASRGTIDDLSLMSGVSTLVAGASKEFGTQLANAYPQLIEYAKAASKLNPHLGDTTYMLESIATGLKRGSPMILDNLGLVVKVGEANENWAKQIGKSVSAMTAEDKSMALLNATMSAGDRLVEQVGGSTESATDAFEQLEAAAKNLKMELARLAEPTGKNIAGAVSLNVEWRTAQLVLVRLRDSVEAYDKELVDSINVEHAAIEKGMGLTASRDEQAESLEWLYEKIEELSEAELQHERTMKVVNAEIREFTLRSEAAAGATRKLTEDELEAIETAKFHEDALDELSVAHHVLKKAQEDDRLKTVDWTGALEAAAEGADSVTEASLKAADAARELEEAQGITVFQAARDALDEMSISAERLAMVQTRMAIASGETTYAELNLIKATELLTADYALGLLSADEYIESLLRLKDGSLEAADVIANHTSPAIAELGDTSLTMRDEMNDLKAEMSGTRDTAGEAAEKVFDLVTEMDKLPEGKDIKIIIDTAEAEARLQRIRDALAAIGSVPAGFGAPAGGPGEQQYQGGAWRIPHNQRAFLHAGEMVIPAAAAQIIRQQTSSVTNNYSLTTNAITRPGGLSMEFAAMSLASR